MKVLWLAPFPVSILQPLPVEHEPFRGEHPAPWTVNLSEAFAKQHPDVELHIATMNGAVQRSFLIRRNGVTFHIVRSRRRLIFSKHWPPNILNIFTRYHKYRGLLCEVIRDVKPDVIHAFGTEYVYSLAAMDSGFPYLIYLQGIIQKLAMLNTPSRISSIRIALEKKTFDHCRYYIAESAFGEKFVSETIPEATVWRVGNSVSMPFFMVRHNGIVNQRLLYVGSIIPAKGVNELLCAVNKNGWVLTMVGENTSKYAIGLMQRYSSNSNIVWTGRIPTAGVAALMETHDALVLPSYMDTSPNVVAEAMAAGLPVVASRVGGIPNMITEGVTGLLFEPMSVESLERGISLLYADPEKMIRMGLKARKVALDRFIPESNAHILAKAYRQVLRNKNGEDP